MNSQPIVITPHVLNTLRALPLDERLNVASALAGELLLGVEIDDLDPDMTVVFSIIRSYIRRDSRKMADALSA